MMNGQAMDIGTLWSRIEELSTILHENRRTAALLNQQTEVIQSRINNQGTVYVPPADHPEIFRLQQENTHLNTSIQELQSLVEDLSSLVIDYENAFNGILSRIREYSAAQSAAMISTVESYNAELANERQTSGELRMQQAELFAQIHKISGMIREAYRASTEADNAVSREMLDLRAENAGLRSQVEELKQRLAKTEEKNVQEKETNESGDGAANEGNSKAESAASSSG